VTGSGGAKAMLERRRERRVEVQLTLKIRGTDTDGISFEETTKTENVCRGGLSFATQRRIGPGADLEISIPVPPRGNEPPGEFTTRGRVVAVVLAQDQRRRRVGVEFTGSRFNRLFTSEEAS
jgi:hypothetical protein